jgi:hypothetical protein
LEEEEDSCPGVSTPRSGVENVCTGECGESERERGSGQGGKQPGICAKCLTSLEVIATVQRKEEWYPFGV